MLTVIVAAVIGLIAVSVPSRPSVAEPTPARLTDADAARVVTDLLNQQSYETLLLGNIVVYPDTVPMPPGNNITSSQYSMYKIWEKLGLINIVAQTGSTPKGLQEIFPSTDWQSQAGQILGRQITVTPTEKATQYGYYFGTTLRIRIATFKVAYLATNEERVIGVHAYRFLAGIYGSGWTPVFFEFCRADNACAAAGRGKFIVLLKLNDFTRRWTVVALDVADINHEFTTHNVDHQLSLLR